MELQPSSVTTTALGTVAYWRVPVVTLLYMPAPCFSNWHPFPCIHPRPHPNPNPNLSRLQPPWGPPPHLVIARLCLHIFIHTPVYLPCPLSHPLLGVPAVIPYLCLLWDLLQVCPDHYVRRIMSPPWLPPAPSPIVTFITCTYFKYRMQHHPLGHRPLPVPNVVYVWSNI